MKKIIAWFSSTVVVLVLLFTYHTSTSGGDAVAVGADVPLPDADVPDTDLPDNSIPSIDDPDPAATSSSPDAGSTGTSAGTTTYTGSAARTMFGNVQVAITVSDGKIVDVTVPVYPVGTSMDREINARALPILKAEVLTAQSADIDTVSGATVTSKGYIQSLQAAIDAAHLK